MSKKPIPVLLVAIFVATLWVAHPVCAATLSPTTPVVTNGSEALSDQSSWGTPDPFWVIPLVDWEQSDGISLSVSVSVPTGDPGLPVSHIVFLTARNSTPDAWQGFEIGVEGSAVFVSIPPPSIGVLDPTSTQLTSTTLVFGGLAWSGVTNQSDTGVAATISFTLDVTPPSAGQPVVLTLRPIPTPEPGSSLLMGAGWLLLSRRQRRRAR